MASRNGMHHVFVYGTLKQGYGNHQRLLNSPTTSFIGTGLSVQPFRMADGTGFPVVLQRGDQADRNGQVKGEIYEVNDDTLRRLDQLEGHPDWYRREEILVDIGDTGIQQSCWMYVGQPHDFAFSRFTPMTPANGVLEWSRQ